MTLRVRVQCQSGFQCVDGKGEIVKKAVVALETDLGLKRFLRPHPQFEPLGGLLATSLRRSASSSG